MPTSIMKEDVSAFQTGADTQIQTVAMTFRLDGTQMTMSDLVTTTVACVLHTVPLVTVQMIPIVTTKT